MVLHQFLHGHSNVSTSQELKQVKGCHGDKKLKSICPKEEIEPGS